jgi:hypothetical protein
MEENMKSDKDNDLLHSPGKGHEFTPFTNYQQLTHIHKVVLAPARTGMSYLDASLAAEKDEVKTIT